jgi:uncharacterized membrane protein
MPDPTEPSQPPPPPPAAGPEPSATSQTTGLPSNMAAAIACIPLIGGIIFYVLEKRDNFVRFYAMQSIIFGIAWILLAIACGIVGLIFGGIPVLGFLWDVVSRLIHLAVFVLIVIAAVKAFSGVRWDIPYIGPMARKQLEGSAG